MGNAVVCISSCLVLPGLDSEEIDVPVRVSSVGCGRRGALVPSARISTDSVIYHVIQCLFCSSDCTTPDPAVDAAPSRVVSVPNALTRDTSRAHWGGFGYLSRLGLFRSHNMLLSVCIPVCQISMN
jgi:hypothetical protein